MMNNFQMGGTMYGYQQPKVAAFTQGLTPEEIAQARKNQVQSFTLDIPEAESLSNRCTHRLPEAKSFAINNAGFCSICGAKVNFNIDELRNKPKIQAMVDEIVNILEMVKTSYVDLPHQFINQYFPIIAYLKRLPALADAGLKNIESYNRNANVGTQNPYGSTAGVYASLMGHPYAQQAMNIGMMNYQAPQQGQMSPEQYAMMQQQIMMQQQQMQMQQPQGGVVMGNPGMMPWNYQEQQQQQMMAQQAMVNAQMMQQQPQATGVSPFMAQPQTNQQQQVAQPQTNQQAGYQPAKTEVNLPTGGINRA